jgi:hypothetical protein
LTGRKVSCILQSGTPNTKLKEKKKKEEEEEALNALHSRPLSQIQCRPGMKACSLFPGAGKR